MTATLIYKIVDENGKAPHGEDTRLSYFTVSLPVSTTWNTTPRVKERHFRWDGYQPEFGEPYRPQPLLESYMPPHALRVLWKRIRNYTLAPEPVPVGTRGTNPAFINISVSGGNVSYERADGKPVRGGGPVETPDPLVYIYKRQDAEGWARATVGDGRRGGYIWRRPNSLPLTFGGTEYTTQLYQDLLAADHNTVPVCVLASVDSADLYETFSFGDNTTRTTVGVRAPEVLYHTRLDSTAESLIPAMLADRATLDAAYQDMLDSPSPTTEDAWSAARLAYYGTNYVGGSFGAYAEAVVSAASAWIAANWP